jgi:hypothetical protein
MASKEDREIWDLNKSQQTTLARDRLKLILKVTGLFAEAKIALRIGRLHSEGWILWPCDSQLATGYES